jgi:peptidoglycan/xylan/chitin deacetylase (PgdA/CDA1 family)
MKIYITLDYEIYFGENHGTVEKCIVYPTSELIRIAEKHGVRFVFFVDSGFILKLAEYKKKFPQLEKDHLAITQQVKYLSDSGHDVQLHIHPHWEDSYYNGEKWVLDLKRYKLADFNENEIGDIVKRYKNVLTGITGKEPFAFRAGGWCLQPFSKLEEAFKENKIRLDSSVFRNGYFSSEQYSYDFRNAPDKDIYRFENDVMIEKKNGFFTELPISAIRNSPLFFWKLFLLGRRDPYLHKPLGDGRAMPAPGYRKKLLTRFTNNPVSIDGYNANLLRKALNGLKAEEKEHMVVIGHPKALSRYSISALDAFIENTKQQNTFTTFAKQFPG